jgi:alpha-ketoglutarate-dependent taurine dioxygenase
MTIELRQIDSQFAFEAIGAPIWSQFDNETVRTLDRTLSRHGVLVFRRQSLSEKELVNFSNLFGNAEKIVRADWASADYAEITRISNMRNAAGDPIGGLGVWRIGMAYRPILHDVSSDRSHSLRR